VIKKPPETGLFMSVALPDDNGDVFLDTAGNRRPLVMGILNITPDSFSDGGCFLSENNILAQAEKMISEGADIIDIGGESSRPFAEPVSLKEEAARVLPSVTAIRKRYTIPISLDTTKAEIARQALDSGADIVNDISGLRFDPAMVLLAAKTGCPVVIMHMQGTPGNMQKNPEYNDVISEIKDFLDERIAFAESKGVNRANIIIDPGIGFGKTLEHNLTIIKHLDQFNTSGCKVLLGHSRKAFIGTVLDREATDRDIGTAIVSAICATKGVDIIRVHDVDKTVQAIKMAVAIENVK